MSLLGDTWTLLLRELLIFRKNLMVNVVRSLVFPLIFILLLGSFGSTPKNVPVAVVNYDNGPVSINFLNFLQLGNAVTVAYETNQQQAMDLLSQGKVAGVVVIPAGISQSITNSNVYVYLDNSQPQSSDVVGSQVRLSAAEVNTKVSVTGVSGGDPGISVVSNYAYGASSNYLSFVVGGLLVMVASFGAIFTAGFTMLTDRQLGNLKAFLTTPINGFSFLLSKILYGALQSIFSAYIGLLIGLLYGATIAAGVIGFIELLWIIMLVGIGFSSVAIAMAARIKQIQTYGLIAQTITMPSSFLAGAFVPVTLLPAFLLPVVTVNPLTYAVNAVRDIMIKGFLPVSTLISTSIILMVFAGVMMAIAFALFKDTSKQI